MRHFLIIITVFTLITSCKADIKKTNTLGDEVVSAHLSQTADKAVFIHLPENIRIEGLQINYFITGSFGGYSSIVQTRPNVWNYEIPTSYEGKSADTLKLIIYSRNYRIKTFDFPTLDSQEKSIELKLEPSKTVPFSGKILLSNQLKELQIQVSYVATWQCVFFQLSDCLLSPTLIASVNLEKDGRFKVDLPDFAGDETIASFGESGKFSFSLQNKQNGKLLFRLKPKDNPKGFDEMQAALNYPTEQVFIPETEK